MKTYLAMILVLFATLGGCATTGGKRATGESSGSMDAHEIDLRLNLVESHINNRQPQFALQEMLKVESVAKNTARYNFDSGLIFLQLQELEKSREGFAKAAAIDESYGEAWNNLGKIEELLNRPQDAEKSYRKALSVLTYSTPEFPACNLGSLYMKQNRPKEAEDFARKALARNWRYSPAYKLLADALNAQNRPADAESVLRGGLEADMQSNLLALALAEHLVRQSKNDEARKYFDQIIKQSPRSSEAKVAKDYLDFLQ